MTEPDPQDVPEVDDLGLSSDDWASLRAAWNTGAYEPQTNLEEEAFRRMDVELDEDYLRRVESDRADAAYRAWAEAYPEEAAARQAEAEAVVEALRHDPDPWALLDPEAEP
jgi:hypothetical protein